MITHDEAVIQNQEKLYELMKNMRSTTVKLEEAKRQIRDWSHLETQHQNELDNLKKQAREISDNLFSEPKRYPVQDWSPAG